jgi:hypothetical protein
MFKNMNDKKIASEERSLTTFRRVKVDDVADVNITQEGKRDRKYKV